MQRFVYITGALDYLVGLATVAPVFLAPDPQQVPSLVTLGAFLWFAAASLMWASHDLATRGCVVVWQALVRLAAVVSTLVALSMGIVDGMVALYGADATGITAGLLGVCVFDGTVSLVYLLGLSRMPGHSLPRLLRGLPAQA